MSTCCIYVLTNSITGKRYVGQTKDIARRILEHSKGKEPFAIGRAVAKYGWQVFSLEILELCSEDNLNGAETAWIARLGTLAPNGYNLNTGGGQGRTVTEEVRARISEATRLGLTPDVIANRATKIRGRPKSAEWRKAMSEKQKNPENVARITALARSMSEDQRSKISASKIGKKMTEESKAKLSSAKKADTANTFRLAEMARSMSPETRAKMSAAAKARCERNARNRIAAGQFA